MAGPLPWEEYQQVPAVVPQQPPAQAAEPGPWDDYQQMPVTDLPAVNALPPDFSGVTTSIDSTASGRQADGWKSGQLRDLMFGVRSVLQGAGGLFGALGGDAINQAVVNPIARKIGVQEARPYREELGYLADRLGLPSPQNATERVYGDIGEALTGTGLTLGAGGLLNAGRSVLPTVARAAPAPQVTAGLGQRAGEFLTAQPGLQVASTIGGTGASGAARESGAGTGGQLAAALAGGLAPSALTAGVPMAVRGAIRGGEANRQNLSQAIDDFAVLGATPSVGQGTGAWSRQGAETLLGAGPTSAGVMARFADRQAEAIGAGLQQQADSLFRNPSAERAGRAIEQGIRGEDGFIRTSRERANQLYNRLDELLPQDERVGIDNVRAALAGLNEEIPGAPSVSRFFQNARLEGIESALSKDAGGIEGVLSRPGMRAQVDQMRADLTEQAALRRAELAQETNQQRQGLVAEAGLQRESLVAEQERLRERIASMIESRRAQLYQEADELELQLRAQQQAAIAENRQRGMFPETSNSLVPVISDEDIARQVPTRQSIDARLPSQADIEAQMMSRADLDAQVMSPQAIEQRLTPDAAINQQNFGSDYVEKQINDYLTSQIDGKLPYEALRKLRTLVGGELENTSLVSDVPRSKWKAVYAALSQDMEAAATTPEAKQALDRANRYFNARATRIDDIDRVIDRNGGPEKIYQAVMGGVKDGGSTLRSVMQSLPEEGQKAVTAAALRRMGLANPGAQDAAGETFSAATFLTNWNKASPEARRALFDRYGPGFSSDLDKVAKVAERIKEGGQAIANPSGTARQGAQFAYWGGLGGALMTGQVGAALGLGLGGAGSNIGARLMTNPRFVKWLAAATEKPVGALPAQINVLKRLASESGDPEIAEAVQALSQSGEQPEAEPN
ncbi:hypothetical protein [Stenotrophomonas maltophilia]|uniref:Uncharacterized protein n=1 Tax=Stenotrophomonas maltophilia TaxID=40324 RepID=A0A4S2D1K0_STEMA|nr:hypothetical protein [Stenotrophomonas maltophilia]TGY35259.1 hypothetical protein E5352_05940 [Stenotrophomonas maltophilia]